MKSSSKKNKRPKQQRTVRQEHQKKPACKGRKSLRGQPEIYDELKESRSFGITLTASIGIDEISQELSISRSELIERIGRRLIQLQIPSSPSFRIRPNQCQVQEYGQTSCIERDQ
ncbi:hypothetical protein H6F68_25475 [Trichocoleus sp. FACHB-262]|nr:hypothetical protein [Trichocoleus sp. FACHB-262]